MSEEGSDGTSDTLELDFPKNHFDIGRRKTMDFNKRGADYRKAAHNNTNTKKQTHGR